MVLVCYRFRTCIMVLMKRTTNLHSNPNECDSYRNCRMQNATKRNFIRGGSPTLPIVANCWALVHLRQFTCTQQIDVQHGDCIIDDIPVHSRWLRASSLVIIPPATYMLKFTGWANAFRSQLVIVSWLFPVCTSSSESYIESNKCFRNVKFWFRTIVMLGCFICTAAHRSLRKYNDDVYPPGRINCIIAVSIALTCRW
jgi:hypothetical protein